MGEDKIKWYEVVDEGSPWYGLIGRFDSHIKIIGSDGSLVRKDVAITIGHSMGRIFQEGALVKIEGPYAKDMEGRRIEEGDAVIVSEIRGGDLSKGHVVDTSMKNKNGSPSKNPKIQVKTDRGHVVGIYLYDTIRKVYVLGED